MKLLGKNPFLKLHQALTRGERLLFYSALVVFVTASLVYGALLIKTQTYELPAYGGTYREGVVGQPSFINPVIPVTETDRVMSRLIFASLADMAESITPTADGKQWNVRLQDDLTWQDGEKITSDDVIFTVDVIHNPDSRSPDHSSFEGVTASRVSELEVQFTLQNAYAFFAEDHLQSLRPIPKHIFADIPVVNFRISPYGLAPVGSGPYRVVSHESDARGFIESFELRASDSYFAGPPYITHFTFKFFRKDPELISAYNLGQIDGFGLATAEPLSERPIIIRHAAHYLESSRYYAVFINQSSAPEGLGELEVRRALSGVLGRQEIVDDVFAGHATTLYGPTTLSHDPAQSFDTDKLRDITLNLIVPDEPFLAATAAKLKRDWETAGASVNLVNRSLRDIQEDVLRNTSYELLLFGNIVKNSNDLFAFWHSSKRFYPDQNLALYQDSATDELLATYRRTLNASERRVLLQEISDRIAADVPAVFLYSPDYAYIATPALGGFDDSVVINTADDRFANVEDWFVKSRRTFRKPMVGK